MGQNQDRQEFWQPKSVEQLAAEQGIHAPQSIDVLIGAAADLWDSNEDFEQFLSEIERRRHEASAA